MDRQDMLKLFERGGSLRAVVLGDLMLDEYLWGKTERISPEAPVQVVEVLREDLRLGGAGNVVSNLRALGCQVTVASVIGDDQDGAELLAAFGTKMVDCSGIFREKGRRTGRKSRVVAAHQQIVRIDRESRGGITAELEEELCSWLEQHIASHNLLLISDYLKGVLTAKVLATAIETARNCKIPVLVDPKGADFAKYRGAGCLTPNRKEAEVASGVTINDEESLRLAANRIMEESGIENLLITRSEEGMSLFCSDGAVTHIPTLAREVFDVTGAGDTVLAMLGYGLASGLPLQNAASLANQAAGIAVGKLGTSVVTPDEIINATADAEPSTERKIVGREQLAELMAAERAKGKKVVFTNGCFDLLHAGHVKYLQAARRLGDLLLLGLNSDASIRRLKGARRPLINQEERSHIMAALDCIDYICIFDEDTPLELIRAVRPQILVKGGDYTPEGVVGRELVESFGGRVELIPFLDGRSTTNIIEKVLERYSEG